MKLIIVAALIYVGYRSLKSWLGAQAVLRKPNAHGDIENVDDVMIKDPVCNVYFPKRNGFPLKASGDGDALYFCSKECRDQYTANQS